MNPQDQFCPSCQASGKDGFISIHSQKERRYRCKACGKSFSERTGTAYWALKKSESLMTVVITLLAYGCPSAAIVAAFGLDARTVQAWQAKAGKQSWAVHEATIGRKQWDLVHVQADEIKVRMQGGLLWITMALMVSTRLWLAVSFDRVRSKTMIVDCLKQVARCALCRPMLLAVDGMNMYQTALKKAFGAKHPVGKQGRLKWVEWGNVVLTQVVKARGNQAGNVEQVVAIGTAQQAADLRQRSKGGSAINSSFIERFNATIRQRLAPLARRSRNTLKVSQRLEAQVYLMGTVYNFCSYHQSLTVALYITEKRKHRVPRTPAMAAALTDHRWTIEELLKFKVQAVK